MFSQSSIQTPDFRRVAEDQDIDFHDLSITSSIDDEPKMDYCSGELFNSDQQQSILADIFYPDLFKEYPREVVNALNQFTKPFAHNKIAKLLLYEANMSFLISQIAYRLSQIPNQYFKSKEIQEQVRISEFFLSVHSMYHTSQIYDMLWILFDDKKISYNWPSKIKEPFLNLITHQKHLIDGNKKICLTKMINYYHQSCIKKCIKLKYHLKYVPQDLDSVKSKFVKKVGTDMFKIKSKLIQKDMNLESIRKHYEDTKLQKTVDPVARIFFKELYKQVYELDRINSGKKDKAIIQLLYLIVVAQLHSQDFPFCLINQVHNSKITIFQNIEQQSPKHQKDRKSMLLELNIQLRNVLPKVYLLLTRNGFTKILTLLHQSEYDDILKQISWTVNFFKDKETRRV